MQKGSSEVSDAEKTCCVAADDRCELIGRETQSRQVRHFGRTIRPRAVASKEHAVSSMSAHERQELVIGQVTQSVRSVEPDVAAL